MRGRIVRSFATSTSRADTECTLYTRAGELEIHFYPHWPSKVGHRKSSRGKTVVSVTIRRWYPVFIIVAPLAGGFGSVVARLKFERRVTISRIAVSNP